MATTHTTTVELTGCIRAEDVKQRRYQLWLEDGSCVQVSFSERDEANVKAILRNRESVEMRISGVGEAGVDGVVSRVSEVTWRRFHVEVDESAPSIADKIAEIFKDVPEEVWEQVPEDLSRNLDHYLYGAPKRYP